MKTAKLKLLPTGDTNSAFNTLTPREILDRYGLPSYLLGSSAKVEKCQTLQVLARALFVTPGIFCPFSSRGCLTACNGHNSGRMGLPEQTTARDKRAALYLEEPGYFLARLKSELYLLEADAMRLRLEPACRLNGSSDIAWERRHPELFDEFPQIQFYDYTKVPSRMEQFLKTKPSWPGNYYLTFSADADTPNARAHATRILRRGGSVTAVFASELPETWWGFPVIDGDTHDARFRDPAGHVVALRAKGLAKTHDCGLVFRHTGRLAA